MVEVTMSVAGALEVMKEVTQKFGKKVLLGAGTILDPETARAALLSGAQFIVTPTLNLDVIKMCKRYSAVIIPGALTPTEILTAWETGADLVKVFPIAQVGGPAYIRALMGPLPHRRGEPPECRRVHQGRLRGHSRRRRAGGQESGGREEIFGDRRKRPEIRGRSEEGPREGVRKSPCAASVSGGQYLES